MRWQSFRTFEILLFGWNHLKANINITFSVEGVLLIYRTTLEIRQDDSVVNLKNNAGDVAKVSSKLDF